MNGRETPTLSREVQYALVNTSDSEDDVTNECEPEKAAELQRIIDECEIKEATAMQLWKFWEESWERRRKPIDEEMEAVAKKKQDAINDLNQELERIRREQNPMPGPKALAFVERDWFGSLCNLIVALNLASMGFESYVTDALGEDGQILLNNLFLTWYVLELSLKLLYFRCSLLFGSVGVVWWNWMDLAIVLSGVAEQWVVPLLTFTGLPGTKLNLAALRALRFLRLLRVLRVLKLVRVFVQGDFSWVQGSTYELIGTVILGVNSITMAVELDSPEWPWWYLLNSIFLAYYTLDIAFRLKFQGSSFFYDKDTLGWNYLDFIIVLEGVADQWVLPAAHLVQASFKGESDGEREKDGGSKQLGILKILRLMRILRLARLCRSIPPLYKLMQGVAEALGGLRWVMVLTMLVLYSGAIVFTTMVSQDIVGASDPGEAARSFGSVPTSLYSLFRIMNGDMDPAEELSSGVFGRVMLVGFIICSNWAILAILTSVVSDNMISSSAAIKKMEEERAEEERKVRSREMLEQLFQYIDDDASGTLEEIEWERKVMGDPSMMDALRRLTLLDEKDIKDAFNAVAGSDPKEVQKKQINFEEFMDYLLRDSHIPADKRSVLKMRAQLEGLEKGQLQTRRLLDDLVGKVDALSRRLERNAR